MIWLWDLISCVSLSFMENQMIIRRDEVNEYGAKWPYCPYIWEGVEEQKGN